MSGGRAIGPCSSETSRSRPARPGASHERGVARPQVGAGGERLVRVGPARIDRAPAPRDDGRTPSSNATWRTASACSLTTSSQAERGCSPSRPPWSAARLEADDEAEPVARHACGAVVGERRAERLADVRAASSGSIAASLRASDVDLHGDLAASASETTTRAARRSGREAPARAGSGGRRGPACRARARARSHDRPAWSAARSSFQHHTGSAQSLEPGGQRDLFAGRQRHLGRGGRRRRRPDELVQARLPVDGLARPACAAAAGRRSRSRRRSRRDARRPGRGSRRSRPRTRSAAAWLGQTAAADAVEVHGEQRERRREGGRSRRRRAAESDMVTRHR